MVCARFVADGPLRDRSGHCVSMDRCQDFSLLFLGVVLDVVEEASDGGGVHVVWAGDLDTKPVGVETFQHSEDEWA